MATNTTLDYTSLAAVLNQTFAEPLGNTIVRSNPILSALPKVRMGTDSIRFRAITGSEHNAGPIADRSVVTVDNTNLVTFTGGILNWATYISRFQLPTRAVEAVAGQPGAIGTLFQTELMEAAKDLADKIAKDLLSGTVANGLVGIQTAIGAGTYAGIDRSVVTSMASTVVDAGNTVLSTEMLRGLDTAFFRKTGYGLADKASMVGFCDPDLYASYTKLMENVNLASLGTAYFRNQNVSDLGVTSIGWLGLPIRRTRELDPTHNAAALTGDTADTRRLYFLDLAQLRLATLDNTLDPEATQVQAIQGIAAGVGTDDLRTSIQILGNRGEMIEGYIRSYIQLAVPDPKSAGAVIRNIDLTP